MGPLFVIGEVAGGKGSCVGYLRDPMRSLLPLMDRAIAAAFAAGAEINAVHRSQLGVQYKSDASPVTVADLRAHHIIAQVLGNDHPLLSEEGAALPYNDRRAWDIYWLVDPLDGTKEFIKGNGEFSVNIALMRNDGDHALPIAGVLYSPVKDLLYFAWKNGGAYKQENAATVTGVPTYERASMSMRLPVQTAREAYTIVASRSHLSRQTIDFIKDAERKHGEVRTMNMGSALKICLVAEGSADVYPRFGPTMEWDTAAGHAICLEAGCELIDATTGKSLPYNKKDLMNTPFIVQRSK